MRRLSDGGSVSASEPEGSRSKARSGPRAFRLAFRLALSWAIFCAAPARAQDFFQGLFGWGQQHSAPRVIEQPAPQARPKKKNAAKAPPGKQQPAQPAAPSPAAEGPPPPYEPQLLRLSEILGALSYLRDLCGPEDGEDWRAKMTSLLEAEAKTGQRRLKLTGAFNRGFRGYETTYRSCTPNARTAISRYLDEGGRIAHDIAYRYGNS
ncbi:TIGR02301 family protein [Methylosinus sp. H3A]|uniref:TIGR02301 family protein n=1 Tax=Methylosinus sp. H3A TaxID=2785786 RepID=UPI0018C23870|nr:TIGR02301 family protein [Methylosinus sp. H3A]MBG0809794.1 TIGR02301 family protein [Methylosinus sp. H3A]